MLYTRNPDRAVGRTIVDRTIGTRARGASSVVDVGDARDVRFARDDDVDARVVVVVGGVGFVVGRRAASSTRDHGDGADDATTHAP